MCHILRKKKGTQTERQIKTSGRRNEPRAHTHTSPSDAPLWINTRSGVEKGNGIKLREARKDKNIGIQSRPLSPEDEPPVFDGCRETRRRKNTNSLHLGFHSSVGISPSLRLAICPSGRGLLAFDLSRPEWSTVRVPIPLISGKLSGQKCLKVKLGEMEEKKKKQFRLSGALSE